MKIGPVGTELFHADKQAENHDAASSCFQNFAKAAIAHI